MRTNQSIGNMETIDAILVIDLIIVVFLLVKSIFDNINLKKQYRDYGKS